MDISISHLVQRVPYCYVASLSAFRKYRLFRTLVPCLHVPPGPYRLAKGAALDFITSVLCLRIGAKSSTFSRLVQDGAPSCLMLQIQQIRLEGITCAGGAQVKAMLAKHVNTVNANGFIPSPG